MTNQRHCLTNVGGMEHTNELLIVLLMTQLVVIVGLLLVQQTLRRLLSAFTLQRSRPAVPPQDTRATDR